MPFYFWGTFTEYPKLLGVESLTFTFTKVTLEIDIIWKQKENVSELSFEE